MDVFGFARREIWRLSSPRDDETKQESDCEGLDRRFARQVRQTVKGTAGLPTRLNRIGDALACRFNGLSRRPNGFCGLTQLSRRISARRFIFAGHSKASGATAKTNPAGVGWFLGQRAAAAGTNFPRDL
jgi:hypothetical protein